VRFDRFTRLDCLATIGWLAAGFAGHLCAQSLAGLPAKIEVVKISSAPRVGAEAQS